MIVDGEQILVPKDNEWAYFTWSLAKNGSEYIRLLPRKGENWDLIFIDGREAFVTLIPNGFHFGFSVQEKIGPTPFQRPFEIVKDIWMRVNFKIIEGSPQLIRLLFMYGEDERESLYIVDGAVAEKYRHIEGRLTYVWNTSEWCTVAVSCTELRDALLRDACIRLFIDGVDGNVTIAIWVEETMMYKPSTILSFEVTNNMEEPIIGIKVRVSSNEAYVALTEPIRGGEKRIIKFAPIGNFKPNQAYDVAVAAIYSSGRVLSSNFSVRCTDGGS